MSRPVVVPIWTPQDSVDTAHQFHMELHNAERGVSQSQSQPGFGNRLMFSRSRERRARRMDALAVALLMIVMAAFGVIVMLLSTPQAKADPDSMVYAYAATFRRGEPRVRKTVTELLHVANIVPSYLRPGAFFAVCESCTWRSPFAHELTVYRLVSDHQSEMKARRRTR